MLAKYALRFSEIAAGLVITSPVLVLSWLMSTCCEGFKFTNSFTIFQILPLLLLFSIINSLRKVIHSFSRSFSSDSSSGEIRQNEKDRSVARLCQHREKMAEIIPEVDTDTNSTEPTGVINSFFLTPTYPNEINNIIDSFKDLKATRYTNAETKFIKISKSVISPFSLQIDKRLL